MLIFMMNVWLMIAAVLKMMIDESVPVGMEISDVETASRFLFIFVLNSPSLFVRVALAAVRWNNMINITPQAMLFAIIL